jgi:hypothetical protein
MPMIPPTVTLRGIWAALIAFAFAVVLALLAVQTIRLEGLKIWPISIEGALPKIERYERTFAEIERTTRETTAKWKAAIERTEQNYRNLAQEADHHAEQARSDALAAADRYITDHRFVCPRNQSGIDRAAASPASVDPGVPASVPADSFVAVSDADVRACSAATAYAVAAHDWAAGLGGASEQPPNR